MSPRARDQFSGHVYYRHNKFVGDKSKDLKRAYNVGPDKLGSSSL